MPLPSLLAARAFLSKAWPFILVAAVAILMVVIYRAGVDAERDRWEAAEARKKVQAEQQARKADEALREAEKGHSADADARRKEMDDATRHIPDQPLTARQRATLCVELRRQARATGAPEPAC